MFNSIFLIISILDSLIVSLLTVKSVDMIWIPVVCFAGTYVICFILLFISLVIISVTIDKNKEYDKFSGFYYGYFLLLIEYACLFFCRVKIKTTGMKKVPKDRKFLLVSNHRSYFDPMLTLIAFRSFQMSFISKPENFKIPFVGKMMVRNCFIPIDRENVRNAIASIIRAQKQIESNSFSVGVYPEGTCNRTQQTLLPFRSGCLKIATKNDVPIVVITIKGTQNIYKRAPWRKTIVKIDVLDVVNPSDFETTTDMADKIKTIMEASLNENSK